jgi:hypothetical protein
MISRDGQTATTNSGRSSAHGSAFKTANQPPRRFHPGATSHQPPTTTMKTTTLQRKIEKLEARAMNWMDRRSTAMTVRELEYARRMEIAANRALANAESKLEKLTDHHD